MINFILIAVFITIIVVILIVRPLFNTKESISYERQEQNIHYAKERLDELEQQLKYATISATDYEALKLEIESTLASDIDIDNNTKIVEQAKETNNGVIVTLLCTLIPFGALLIYQFTGTPAAINLKAVNASQTSAQEPSDIEEMIARVEQRLKDDPNNIQGWKILANTYLALGRYEQSINANLSLLKINVNNNSDNANIYARLADAAALQAGGSLIGQPTVYIEKALEINPQQPQALWLAGMSAAEQGQNDKARDYWNILMPLLADLPQQQQELQSIIQQTFGQKDHQLVQQKSQPINEQSSLDRSTTADIDTDDLSPNISGIRIKVSLAQELIEQVKYSDAVFIFAKAKNGPPAPLAVKRLRVADLPIEVTLSDADSMMPQFKISLFEDIIVNARIAKSGGPIAQPGDIQSKPVITSNKTKGVIELIISEVIK